MGQVVEADLLVIGAGGAGCVAAIEGKRQGAHVLLPTVWLRRRSNEPRRLGQK